MPDFDIEKWSKRLNLPYVPREWFNYYLGDKWGNRSHTTKIYNVRMGKVMNLECKKLNQRMNMILNSIIDGKWENCCSLYSGIIAFCLKYCASDIEYYEDNRQKHHVSVSKCCEELKFPTWCRSKLEKIFKMQLSFEDYLHSFDGMKKFNFDTDSAIMVYKMQGDKAIFSILMQLFFTYKHLDHTNANLVYELPIIWKPKVSDLVSGTSFPVVATKFSNNFEWKIIDDNVFLFDEFNNPIDCASVGFFNVFKESLGNRLSFCSRSGFLPDYVICWSWNELIDAVGHYNGDILVRNLSGGYEGWFRFGLGGQLAVWTYKNRIYGRKSSRKSTWKVPNVFIENYPGEGWWKAMVNLNGDRCNDRLNEEIIYTYDEICDWFEIAKLCKKKLNQNE